MVHEQAVLQVLAGVREVQAEQFRVPAGAGVADRGGQPDHPAAQADHGVLERRVPPHPRLVMRQVDRVSRPVLDADHGQRSPIPDHELDIVGVRRRPRMVENDHGSRVPSHFHEGVPEGGAPCIFTAHRHHGRLVHIRVSRDADDGACLERGERFRAYPVGGQEGGPEPGVSALRIRSGDTWCGVHMDPDLSRRQRGIALETAQAAERREPPLLLAAARHQEISQVGRVMFVQP
jgi:hypothetical protein